jgi:colanic acid/amylovoran biosynthesis glycosyltransferase
MRIVHLLDQFPSLSETFVLDQITGLMDRGHEVRIVARARPSEDSYHPDVDDYNLLDRVTYLSIPRPKSQRILEAVRRWKNQQFRGGVGILRSLNPLRYGRDGFSLKLLFLLLAFQGLRTPDIVHAHFGPHGRLATWIRRLGAFDAPIVTSFYGRDISELIDRNGPAMYRGLFRDGDYFLALSDHVKKRLVTVGCDRDNLTVHRAGIDLDRFEPKPKNRAKSDEVRILSVGRLVEKKGLKYGIKAVHRVLKEHDNVVYEIIGNGPLKESLEQLIGRLGCGDKIRLLGGKTREEVVDHYDRADLLLFPSVTASSGDKEGQGIVLQEAQAMKLPVVSTFHNGIPEGVSDGETGFLVPEQDVVGLADKLMELIENPEKRNEMGRAGRRFVREHFNQHKLNDDLESIYRDLVGRFE